MNNEDLKYAVNNIKNVLGDDVLNSLISGLPGAKNQELCYDIRLFLEISGVIDSWKKRTDGLLDPWVVSYFNGDTGKWTVVVNRTRKELAYKEWFNLTNCGNNNCDSTFYNFYYLGKYGEKLIDRNSVENPEDDSESIKYLIEKSFR